MKKYYLLLLLLTIPILLFLLIEGPVTDEMSQVSSGIRINEVMFQNTKDYDRTTGASYDWVELYNPGDHSLNLKGYGLSDDIDDPFKWTFGSIDLKTKDYLVLYGGHDLENPRLPHLPFAFEAGEEGLFLSNPEGKLISQVLPNNAYKDETYGYNDVTESYVWFSTPSLDGPNNTFYHLDRKVNQNPDSPELSHEQGYYQGPIDLSLTTPEEAQIYYTLDGSDPSHNSPLYQGPIQLTPDLNPNNFADLLDISYMTTEGNPWARPSEPPFKAIILKALTYIEGQGISDITTATYIITEEGADKYSFPVLSLICDPDDLFDHEVGIYVGGQILEDQNLNYVDGSVEANYNQRGIAWEKPVNLTLFDTNGHTAFQQDLGLRTHGAWSRANPQKGLRLFARESYGQDTLSYELFAGLVGRVTDQPIDSYKRFLVRAAGNDWEHLLFRDAFMQKIAADTPSLYPLDDQAWQPVILFINGEYWGIHNLRETVDTHTLSNHYGIPSKDITILEGDTGIMDTVLDSGLPELETAYKDLMAYVDGHDLSDPDYYNNVADQIDLVNHAQYMVAQTYYGNTDWPGNNIRYWRINEALEEGSYGTDGKWRYMLYDTDFGFHLYEYMENNVTFDSISFAAAENGPVWPNPEWSTVLFRNLLESETYQQLFINTYADYLNTGLSADNVVAQLDSFKSLYTPELKEHHLRYTNMDDWSYHYNRTKAFGQQRSEVMWQHLENLFDVGDRVTINLTTKDPKGGSIHLNQIEPLEWSNPYSGTYFSAIPITLTALPKEGYSFNGWQGINQTKSTITLLPEEAMTIEAVFTKD